MNSLRLIRTAIFCVCLTAFASALAKDLTVDEIYAKARVASGVDSAKGTWKITGSVNFGATKQRYEIVFDDQYRFVESLGDSQPAQDGFDGKICWILESAQVPHAVMFGARDTELLTAWVSSGLWAEPDAPLHRELTHADADQWIFSLTTANGSLKFTLALDAKTAFPKTLTYWTAGGDRILTFGEYKPFGTRRLAARLSDSYTSTDISSAEKLAQPNVDYAMPAPSPEAAAFDSKASPAVKLKFSKNLIFVRPKINGKDAGCFVLDTGASCSCVDFKVAKRLKLDRLGILPIAGTAASLNVDVCRAKSLQLGPLTLKNPILCEYDCAVISQIMGIPVSGICGYDCIAHAAFDIDLRSSQMRVLPPREAKLPRGIQWTKLDFDGNTPVISARYDDHDGRFTLDTGNASSLDLFSPEVERLHLLDGRHTESVQSASIGGTTKWRMGNIRQLAFGGNTVVRPEVGFQVTKIGAFSCPYLSGNLGMGILQLYRMVIDYQHQRIAFIFNP